MQRPVYDLQITSLPLPSDVPAGTIFAQLTVLSREANDAFGRVRLLCKCTNGKERGKECGKECVVRLSDLRSGHTKSCGCLRVTTLQHRFPKMRGRVFGWLAVGGIAGGPVRASTEWVTQCVLCGRLVFATTSQLRLGRKRCICLEGTYSSWRNMIQRCTNSKHDQYLDYGGRGIIVCTEWRASFRTFYMDMGRRPEGTSLDKTDNNGHYCRANCKWSPRRDQALNRRSRTAKQVW
jgi:hypothetical protein